MSDTSNQKKLRLLKFGSDHCGPCVSMKRARTLERFGEKYPEVECFEIDVDQKDGDAKATRYGVQGIPTLVFESLDGIEIAREDGGMNLLSLEKLYKSVKSRMRGGE